MKNKILLSIIIVLLMATACLAPYRITNRAVKNPRMLTTLLQDRIGTLDDQVATLQAASTSGIYENLGTGDVFYVDSATGDDADAGTTWALAKETLDAGVGLCTDGNHDIIYVASKHLETLTADVTFDIDDITVIGIGNGDQAPTFTLDTITDEFIIDACGVTLYNLRLVAGVADVATGIDCQDDSDYFSIIACEFPEPPTATHDFTTVIGLTTGADNGTVAYCTFINQAANPGNSYFIDGGVAAIDSLTVIGNHVNADSAGALIFSDKADTNLIIANNVLIQEDVDKLCIELSSTATGIISNNLLCNLGGTAYLLDPGSCHLDNNRANTAIDSASFVFPLEPAEGRTSGQGVVLYVDSGTAGAGDGRSWGTALATLDAAVDLCSSLAGDTIYIAEGHTETLGTGADGVDVDSHNIEIIGLGQGKSVPYFDYDTTTDEFVIAGDNIKIKNLRFHSNITAVVTAIDIEAAALNFVIEDCVFDLNSTGTDDFIDAITVGAGAHGGVIRNCTWRMGAGADNDSAIHFANADYLVIEDCTFYGDFVDAAIFNETTKSLHVTIRNNIIFQGTEDGVTGLNAKPCISLHTDTSGVIVNNDVFCNVATETLAIIADECFLAGNTYNESAGGVAPLRLGQLYVRVSAEATVASSPVNLFAVAGGPIEIVSMFGVVVTVMGSNPGDMNLEIDATTGAYDADFTEADTVDGMGEGDIIVMGAWTTGEVALDMSNNESAGQPVSWYCPIGNIAHATTNTGTGGVVWYMTFRPLVDGVTVSVL